MRLAHYKVKILWLLQAAAVLTVVFSFLTGVDIPYRNIELFSHFRLQYLIVSLLLTIVFVVRRNAVFATALFIASAFNASFVLPWYLNEVAAVSGTPLTLVHINVRASNHEYHRLVDFVHDEDPDLVFFQEVTPEWVAGTSELLRRYPHTYAEPRHDNFGIAVYSKLPFDSIRHIDSPPLGYPTIEAKATLNGTAITFISSHPTIPLGRFRYESRNVQLASIAELVNLSSDKVILLGDFNASIWDRHYQHLEAATGLRNVRDGFGVLPSWPTFMPLAMIPIDHALVSTDIGVVDVRIGRGIGSDHRALIVTVTL